MSRQAEKSMKLQQAISERRPEFAFPGYYVPPRAVCNQTVWGVPEKRSY
jgi:hypothetical protein